MPATHDLNATILREYDIRGVVGETLSAGDAYAIGRAFGTAVRKAGGRTVCIGYDGRLTSPELESAVVRGLRECGLTVWRVGLGPTPLLYYATKSLAADAGLMVTGSHNPPDHNGFKMVLGKAPFFGAAIQELGRIAAAGAYTDGPLGEVVDRPVFESYVERLVRGLTEGGGPGRPLTVAWDAGNGATGQVMSALTARLPGRHVLLNEAIDGRFPAHHPDPTVEENLRQLQAAVLADRCDLGIAFDGDGDRLGAVDNEGRTIWADQLMILFAQEVLQGSPGAAIIADVKSSQVLFDEIAQAGGRPLMWRTGHSLIKSKMAETGAPLAGEMSGHIFFGAPYYGYDDGLYAAVRLLGIVGRSTRPLSEIRRDWPAVVNTPEVRFPVDEARKFAIMEEIRQRVRDGGADVNDIDGVRVRTADGWWLLRASNTQAILVARCEGRDAAGLERLKQSVNRALREVGQSPPAW
ncbi:MAG: phosphoglucomutase/phosphomannomutase PgmG [Dongiaceae bacterium]